MLTFSLILLRFLLANFRSTSEPTESCAKGGCSAFLKPKTKTSIAHTSTIPTGNAYCECWSNKPTSMAIQKDVSTCVRTTTEMRDGNRVTATTHTSTTRRWSVNRTHQRTRYRSNYSKHSTLVGGLRNSGCQAGARSPLTRLWHATMWIIRHFILSVLKILALIKLNI